MKLRRLLFTGILGLTVSLNALDFNNGKINDELYLASLNNVSGEIKSYGDSAVIWYLDKYKNKELQKYINDEFELDDLKIRTKKEFFEKIKEMNTKYMSKEFTLNARTTFDDYNFQGQYFPLKMAGKDSYYSFSGGAVIPYSGMKVFFENTNIEIEKLPMIKDKAKKFVKSKKDSYGNVNRELTAKYTLKIKLLDPNTQYYNYTRIKDCIIIKGSSNKYTNNCDTKNLRVIVTIIKADIYDGNKLLHTIKY